MSQLIESSLVNTVKSAKPKYKSTISLDRDSIVIDTQLLQTSVIKRQETLIQYIDTKYANHKETYLTILEELEIIDKK
jgi:hypothetical protein